MTNNIVLSERKTMNLFFWLLLSVVAAQEIKDYVYTSHNEPTYAKLYVDTTYGIYRCVINSDTKTAMEGIPKWAVLNTIKNYNGDKSFFRLEMIDNQTNSLSLSFPVEVSGINKTVRITLEQEVDPSISANFYTFLAIYLTIFFFLRR